MAHNLEILNGTASFFSARVPAWHNLGTVTPEPVTLTEALALSRADFPVNEGTVYDADSNPIEGYKSLVRGDNGVTLSIVGQGYGVIRYEKQFEFIEKALGEGRPIFETAGILGKGERMFVTAKLPARADIQNSGDIHELYLVGIGGYGDGRAARYIIVETRVVCQNTLEIAIRQAGKKGVSYRHTKNGETRMMSDSDILASSVNAFELTVEKLEELATRRLDNATVATTLASLFGITENQKLNERQKQTMYTVKDLFESNDDDAFPQFRGTAYNLLNATTEFMDHYRPVRQTSARAGQTVEIIRAETAMFGDQAEFKRKALDAILDATKYSPRRTPPMHFAHSAGAQPMTGADVLSSILN